MTANPYTYTAPTDKIAGERNDSAVYNAEALENLRFLHHQVTAFPQGRRNALINGDMSQNQRVAGAVTTDAAYPVDRWFVKKSTSSYSAQQTAVSLAAYAAAPKWALAVGVTGSGGAGDYVRVAQQIEDVRTFAGQTVVVSFWAKATPGTPSIGVEFEQFFGTGGSPSARVTGTGVTVALTSSWAFYEVEVAVPSISGKTIGTTDDSYLQLNLWLSAGSTYATRAGGIGSQTSTFTFTDAQVEAGSVATPFERPGHQGNLAACRRYFRRLVNGNGKRLGFATAVSTTVAYATLILDQPMRTSPTHSVSAASHFSVLKADATALACSAIADASLGQDDVFGFSTTHATGTVGGYSTLVFTNSASATFDLSAEFTPA